MEKNKVLFRFLQKKLSYFLKRGKSVLILGPRQVGKTTLVELLLEQEFRERRVLVYNLLLPKTFFKLSENPELLKEEVEFQKTKPIVFIDEVQRLPQLLDVAQYLIDKGKAQFVLTGSSARKLRRRGVNLAPGRLIRFFLPPLTWSELGFVKQSLNPKLVNFEETLIYGRLPGIVMEKDKEVKKELLTSYSQVYLQEEIRAEAISRKIGEFSSFLQLSALESGKTINFANLSQQIGVSIPTIKSYYQILEDTLIAFKLPVYKKSARERVVSSSRWYIFDIGVRNALARLPLSPELLNLEKGVLFEHFVILELFYRLWLGELKGELFYWRKYSGVEVDCVLKGEKGVLPIEIKAKEFVSGKDVKGLARFLQEHKEAKEGVVVALTDRPARINDKIVVLPWREFLDYIAKINRVG